MAVNHLCVGRTSAHIDTVMEPAKRTLLDVGGNCRAQRKEFDMPAEEAKLLPCPFCGSEAHIHYTPDDVAWWVTCDKCEADGPWGNDCVDKWNRRADIKEVRSTTSTNSAIMPLLKAATA